MDDGESSLAERVLADLSCTHPDFRECVSRIDIMRLGRGPEDGQVVLTDLVPKYSCERMPRRFAALSTTAAILTLSVVSAAHAQGTGPKVSVSGLGLLSIQPVDDAYVGSPYLDEGLGGIGPGFAAGLRVATNRLALAFEYSWATLEVEQSGRLVGGTATGGLQDGLLSFLVGGDWRPSSSVELTMLGGPSLLLGSPTGDGVPIDQVANPANEGEGTLSLTVGSDLTKWFNQRIGLTAGARYTLVPRSRRAEELGIGRHIIRAGVGLEFRLGR